MPVDAPSDLIALLRKTRLLAPSQMEELTRVLQPTHTNVRSLARALIERDWLTPYQVNQLLQGEGRDLLLGQYVLLQRLNETTLGQGYKARHQHMKRLAVLTIVREKLLAQPGAVERFYQEIQAVSRLNHTNLACAFDAGPINRSHFFALEFVEGLDLDQLVHQSGPLPVPLAAHLIRQVALGLQHAHERGLLHHDLKPANLLVTRLGGRAEPTRDDTPRPKPHSIAETQVKVCNLGLTLLLPRPCASGDDSTAGRFAADGSTDFCSPELVPGTPLTDVRSNLYSLGCIFYYLLSGRLPFPGGNPAVTFVQHQGAEAVPLQELRWELPPEICDIVCRLMAKRPEDRIQTPAELANHLAPWCIESETATGPTPKPARWAGLLRRPWFLGIGAGLVLLLGIALLVHGITSPSGEETVHEEPAKDSAPAVIGWKWSPKATREETILATLRENNLPSLEGKWYVIGTFDNNNKKGFETVYPPEKGVDLKATYPGKGGPAAAWKEFDKFRLGHCVNLRIFPHNDDVCVYLYHEFEASSDVVLPVSFGSDDTLTVWFNGGPPLVSQNVYRGCAPDQARANLNVKPGKNQLLLKVCNGNGDFAVYVQPLWPTALQELFNARLNKQFPPGR